MTIQMIPLNQLVLSKSNVRKTNVSAGIEELAASIEAHGLLQNLQVRVAAKGKYEVVAGGRRLTAMTILRRQKKLAKDFPVPCHVIDEADAGEVSLAENIVRLAMHPADQFDAFKAMADKGVGIEEIAARFGVTATVVRQRLKLASVSPALMEVYREGEMTLDQLMAFTISDDHAAQEAVWFEQPAYRRFTHGIRAMLTEAQVEADDRRVRFIGLETYLAAGGGLNRDLFDEKHQGFLTDAALLDRLTNDKLAEAADGIRAEGWAWIEFMPLASLAGYGRVRQVAQPLDSEQSARRSQLAEQYDALVAEHGDEPDGEVVAQMDALWDEIDTIENQSHAWRPEDLAIAGAILSLDYDGELTVERGLVRPEDTRRQRSDETPDRADTGERPSSGLSAALVESLTYERTAVLRAVAMDNQQVALASLCHVLALPLFFPWDSTDGSALRIELTSKPLGQSDGLTSRAYALLDERQAAWMARLPQQPEGLFCWLLEQETAILTELLTYCAALSIDAVRGQRERADAPRQVHADAIAKASGLDMRDWWSPTKANYLGRVSKALALEAVREGVSAQAAENLAMLKKGKLSEAAEQRLAGTGWLPSLLRASVGANAEEELQAAA